MVPSDLFSDYDTVMCSIPLVSDPFQTFPNADYAGFLPCVKKYLNSRFLKITEKVSFKIASEASYV